MLVSFGELTNMANRDDSRHVNMANGDDSRHVNEVTLVKIPEGATHIAMANGDDSRHVEMTHVKGVKLVKIPKGATHIATNGVRNLLCFYDKGTEVADASTQTDDSFHSGNSATQTKAAKHFAIHSVDASIDSATSSPSEDLWPLPPHRRLTSSAPDDEFKQPPGTQHEPTPNILVEELPGTQHEPTPPDVTTLPLPFSINLRLLKWMVVLSRHCAQWSRSEPSASF
jgi:hypothetical protein